MFYGSDGCLSPSTNTICHQIAITVPQSGLLAPPSSRLVLSTLHPPLWSPPGGGWRRGTAFQKSAEKLEGGHRENHPWDQWDQWGPMAAKTMGFIAFRGRHTGRISRIGPIGRTYSRPPPLGLRLRVGIIVEQRFQRWTSFLSKTWGSGPWLRWSCPVGAAKRRIIYQNRSKTNVELGLGAPTAPKALLLPHFLTLNSYFLLTSQTPPAVSGVRGAGRGAWRRVRIRGRRRPRASGPRSGG